ncbi:MAG TPA: MmoB/DmpM family protein [Planctomycetota bacterium]|nr:MmoB/DmpM family protein [Planctomycetota bacterium]
MGLLRAAALDELTASLTPRIVGGTKVLLVRVGGTVSAFEDRCAHLGQPLSGGSLENGTLTCPAHEWQYDARTGRGVNPQTACLKAFPVTIREGQILLDLDARPPAPEDVVGPVLEAGDTARAVVEAIRRLNGRVEIIDRGAYVRVQVPRRCVVTREAIERSLGYEFHLPGDLERVMPAFQGRFSVSEDEAVWLFEEAR